MKEKSGRGQFLATTLLSSIAFTGLGSIAYAQTQPAPAASGDEEIVVTGSRIAHPDVESTSPLQVVGEQEVTYQGRVAVEDLLATLPAVQPEFNQGVDNGTTGTASTSLRGLTSVRTLVLVNGNRLMAGDPRLPTADLNMIPSSMIQRVEVVTGGASAVYGSDAVAGVVNFIMRDNFQGVRVDGQTSFAWHDNNNSYDRSLVDTFNKGAFPGNEIPRAPSSVTDAETLDLNIVIGANTADDKGNVTAYAGWRRINPLTQDQRDTGACGISVVNPTGKNNPTDGTYLASRTGQKCQGSSNSAFGDFFTPDGFRMANDPAGGTNTFTPYTGGLAFNFGPYNYYQQDNDRYTAGFFSHYEIRPWAVAYANLMFMDVNQNAQAAPSGLFTNNGNIYVVSCDNPLASAQQLSHICSTGTTIDPVNPSHSISAPMVVGYRLEGTPRNQNDAHTDFQLSGGLRGQINDDWSYDIHMQYGASSFRQNFTGDVSNTRINQALDAIDDGSGGAMCADPAARAAGCVPLNIFQPRGGVTGTITPDQLAWVLVPTLEFGHNTTQIVTATMTGDLGSAGGRSPWAEDGIGVAVGAEYRRETLNLVVDLLKSSGDLSGSGGVTPPASGQFDVFEVFGEARIPVVQHAALAEDLTLELGYRTSDYSLAGRAEAYKISVDYEPVQDLRFRLGYNRAVRAPNIVELFGPQVVALEAFQDPCAGNSGTKVLTGAALTACQNTFSGGGSNGGSTNTALLTNGPGGATSVPLCAAAQCSGLQGGNLSLTPEIADTYTYGVVYTPRYIPGLRLTLDYYNIKINNTITTIGGAVIVSQCAATGAAAFCDLIHRDPVNGSLFGITTNQGYVIDPSTNIGSIETTGWDMTGAYSFDFGGLGSLDLSYTGTIVDEFKISPGAVPGSYDCLGLYGPICGQPLPDYKHEMRVTWHTPYEPLTLSLNWRHIGSVDLDLNDPNPFLGGPGVDLNPHDAHLPAYDYFDIAGTWNVTDNVRLRAGIDNLMDKDPPLIDANNIGIAGPPFGNGNTFPGVYDVLGRVVFLGVTADF